MLARTAPITSLVVLLLAGCSGASSSPGSPEAGQHADAATPNDAGPPDTASPAESGTGDANDAGPGIDATSEAGADATSSVDSSGAGSGPCASCTASMCLTALEACAASSECTNALVTFNACFTAPSLGASCGATLATQGSEAAALWACLSTMCKSTCL